VNQWWYFHQDEYLNCYWIYPKAAICINSTKIMILKLGKLSIRHENKENATLQMEESGNIDGIMMVSCWHRLLIMQGSLD
jgi:hypothetical protein